MSEPMSKPLCAAPVQQACPAELTMKIGHYTGLVPSPTSSRLQTQEWSSGLSLPRGTLKM
jgi:hypothetical protein